VAGRKRVYTGLSLDRYFEKSVKIHLAQGIPLEIAVEHARRRATAWKGGFDSYHSARKDLKSVLDAKGIAPSARAPFYALLNELKRSGQYWAKIGTGALMDYIRVKYPTIADETEIINVILDAVGIEPLPAEERPTTPPPKAG